MKHKNRCIAPSGFEPLSTAPKAVMIGRYTTGLQTVIFRDAT